MKTIILITLISLCASCTMVYFEEPQPAGKKSLHEFPAKLQGTYSSADDSISLHISSTDIIYRASNENDLKFSIKNDLIIKKFQGDYYLNVEDKDNNFWSLYLLSPKGKKLIMSYPSINDDNLEKFQKITEIRTVHSKEKEMNEFILNPQLKELKKLIKAGIYETSDTLFKK